MNDPSRLALACGIAAVLGLGCSHGGATPPPATSPAASIEPAPAPLPVAALPPPLSRGAFAECSSDCRFDFRELEAQTARVVQRYCRDAVPECIAFEGKLTPAGRAQLQALEHRLAEAKLERTYGCGKCYDGNDYSVVVRHADGQVTEHSYDATRTPDGAVPVIRDAHPLFESIRLALETCVSNELVQIGADCTPHDALSPRPYSRP